jgi:hypothetical protein
LISASHPPHQITNSWIEYTELLLYFKRKNVEECVKYLDNFIFYPLQDSKIMAEEVVGVIES